MWNAIFLNIVLSIIIIFASHQIWEYCKSNYTTHKIKNVADSQASKYKSMLEDMERAHALQQSTPLRGANASALTGEDVSSRVNLLRRASQNRGVDAQQPEPIEHSLTHPQFISMEDKEWIQSELEKFIQDM